MKKELKQARLRLMLLYMAFGTMLVALVGGVSYGLLTHFLQSSVDGLLKQKMALLYQSNSLPLPVELASVLDSSLITNSAPIGNNSRLRESDDHFNWSEFGNDEHAYANDLAGIFILPLDDQGKVLANPNPFTPPISADLDASKSALQTGSDIRTIKSNNGTSYRLLTYHLPGISTNTFLQLGKSLGEQQRLAAQYLGGIILIGLTGVAALGLGSWWLSKRALQPAMQAWDQQQSFIANAGHELRTPLTIIRSSMEVVQRTPLDKDQKQLVGDVLTECDHMNKLVEDLLLLSRLDHQRLTLEFSSIDLKPFIEEVCRKVNQLANNRKIRFSLNIKNGSVLGDPLRLRQVLLILLDNALRNIPSGGQVKINTQSQSGFWQIQVTDSGVGIPVENLSHIFERFYRVNRPSDKDYSGNGLGLSIAKSIIEAQHGQILITSEVGKGTTVTITLPKDKKVS
jgi:signal transduction histidine kinase